MPKMGGDINKEGERFKSRKSAESRKGAVWLFLALILGGVAFGVLGTISIFKFGQGEPLKKTAAVISETFKDIFRPHEERAAFEVDIGEPGVGLISGDNAASRILGVGQEENSSGSQETAAANPKLKIISSSQTEVAAQQNNTRDNSSPAVISNKTSSSASAKSPAAAPAPSCSFSANQNPSRKVLFNELAWMGMQTSVNDEWLELRNAGSQKINLAGWRVLSDDENIEIIFEDSEAVSANGFYLLERTDDNSIPNIKADAIYKGSLSNSGAWLKLFDNECNLIDEVNASAGWPAGDNGTKKTMERNETDLNWHTSSIVGGTPKAKNSSPAQTVSTSTIPISSSQSSSSQSQTGNATTTTLKYILTVLKTGSSTGSVTSEPAGIICGADCSEEFLPGTSVVLSATASSSSSFAGWSGPCTWTGTCAIILSTNTLVTAQFDFMSEPPPASPSPPSGGGSSGDAGHIIISEVMYELSNCAKCEFVELYNPTSQNIDLKQLIGDDRLRIITSSGSIGNRIITWQKTIIPPKGHFLFVSSDYQDLLSLADATYSAYLTNQSGVQLTSNNGGTIIDEVRWSKDQFNPSESWERISWDSDQFSVQPSPNPQNSSQ